jgi:outer membrane protein assembly factor BamB
VSASRSAPLALALCTALAVTACGSHAAGHSATTARTSSATAPAQAAPARAVPDGDWTTFDFDPQRSGVGPASTGITAANASRLTRRTVRIDGVADSSAIQLHAIRLHGRKRDVVVLTTTYGRTIALDPNTGAKLWEFAPSDIGSYQGSSQITTASPVADPDRRYVYAASPDGFIHKLSITTGRQAWAGRITFDPRREKIEGGLNISGGYVVAATGGYYGDAPTYEGHVALLERSSGHVAHVFNADCSNIRGLIDPPSSCRADTTFGGSAIWGREGAVLEPGTRRIVIATGNGPFNGSTNWGDSVLVLSADATKILHTWTPRNQAQLNSGDVDLGSTEPALLPGGLSLQGGKQGLLSLLDLGRQGVGGTGGELQTMPSPNGAEVLTTPAVFGEDVFVADDSGTTGYAVAGGRIHGIWEDGSAGTSPVVAGGLLYVYDERAGMLRVLRPGTGATVATLPAASGHWSSPIIVGGRVILPVGGSTSDNALSGVVYIYHLAGR